MGWVWRADRSLFFLLNGRPGGALAHGVALAVLWLSSGGACWLTLFAVAFVLGGRRGRRLAVTGVVALLLAHAAAVWGLEGLAQRASPVHTYAGVRVLSGVRLPRFSLPATRMAEACAAWPLLRRGGGLLRALVDAFTAAVAWSAVYSGAHFPSDVAAGALIGLLGAAAALWLLGDPAARRQGAFVPLPTRVRRGRRMPGPGRA